MFERVHASNLLVVRCGVNGKMLGLVRKTCMQLVCIGITVVASQITEQKYNDTTEDMLGID